MPVPVQDPINVSQGNGITSVYPYNFRILAAADLLVTVDGVPQTLSVHYTVDGVNDDDGGDVTFLPGFIPANGSVVSRERNMAFSRSLEYQVGGDLRAPELNDDQDAPVMMLQQLKASDARSLKVSITIPPTDPTLPPPEGLAPLVWASDGSHLENGSTTLTGDMLLRGELANTGTDKGAELVYTKQSGAGAVARSQADKNAEQVSVLDFGAVGNGVANDTVAFVAATAVGVPVYVPYTTQFYALTALTNSQLELLWGPGLVKIAGIATAVSSSPRAYANLSAGASVARSNWTPDKWPSVEGSLTNGAAYFDVTRTGGFGTYGNSLNLLHVTAALPAGQLDTAETAWVTGTNLTGGQLFGAWFGANTPAQALAQTYSGGAAIGMEVNVGNRWSELGLQSDLGGTRYTAGIQLVADVLPAKDGTNDLAVTSITIASPGVVTLNGHGLPAWAGVVFSGAGTIPTGLVKGQLYFVSATGLTANTFQVAASVGGASINTTGSFAAPITARPSYGGSFGLVLGQSVWAHRWWIGTLIRPNTIMAGGYANYHRGGTVATMAPAAIFKSDGFWARGLDLRGAQFSNHGIDFESAAFTGAAINFDFTASNSSSATAGGVASPGNFQGFVKAAINGNIIKIPYFNN